MRKKISVWVLNHQTKAIIILFAIIFILAALLPEGGGDGGNSGGSGNGSGNDIGIGSAQEDSTKKHDNTKFKDHL